MSTPWNDATCRVVGKRRQAAALQMKASQDALTENHNPCRQPIA